MAEADRLQWADRAFRGELSHWLRSQPDAAADGIPAHELGIQDWLSFAGPSLIRTFDRGKGQAARDRDIAVHSPVLAVLGSAEDHPAAWLQAGQALQALLLRAQAEGLGVSHLNQPIEVATLRQQVAELCGRSHPQVLLRFGYAEGTVNPTPRRSVRTMLVQQSGKH